MWPLKTVNNQTGIKTCRTCLLVSEAVGISLFVHNGQCIRCTKLINNEYQWQTL